MGCQLPSISPAVKASDSRNFETPLDTKTKVRQQRLLLRHKAHVVVWHPECHGVRRAAQASPVLAELGVA